MVTSVGDLVACFCCHRAGDQWACSSLGCLANARQTITSSRHARKGSHCGLTLRAHIAGSLLSGFTLSEISYTGSQGIQSLQIDSLAVNYRLLELFDSKIREITVNRATVIVDQHPVS